MTFSRGSDNEALLQGVYWVEPSRYSLFQGHGKDNNRPHTFRVPVHAYNKRLSVPCIDPFVSQTKPLRNTGNSSYNKQRPQQSCKTQTPAFRSQHTFPLLHNQQ
jgi:hypothetical protein